MLRLVATGNGHWVPIGSFDVSDFGIGRPRGLTVDALSGNLLLLDRDGYIVELNLEREFVREIDLSSAQPHNTGGVVLLPGNDATRPLLVVGERDDDDDDDDDVVDDDDERAYLFSFALPVSDPPPTATPPVVTTTPTGTLTATPDATLTPGPTATGTPTGTPIPQPQNAVAYLPLLAMQRDHDDAGEPNDDCTRAFPLLTDNTYAFMAEDAHDWYHFSLSQSVQLSIHLTHFTPRHGQIAIFAGPTCSDATFLMNNGDSSEQKSIFLGAQPAGHYYIYVSNDGEATTDRYHLQIETE